MAKKHKSIRVRGNIGKKKFDVQAKIPSSSPRTKKDDSILFAFLATFLSVIGFIIALLSRKNDEYVMFYAKQSLVIFVVAVIVGVVHSVLVWIPVFGWIISNVLGLFVLVLWIASWLYALSGEKRAIPIIIDYANKIDL